ncbi:MAG: glycosyltransferase, partial [Actinomycetota bacterium]|nr:glycosyltransferase [Actinomycetota bacterium]
ELGVNTLVLDDTPMLTAGRENPPDPDRRLVVLPASFDPDEPIEAVMAAATAHPDIELVMTGRDETGRLDGLSVPDNVRLVGYVSREEYEQFLSDATAVCSLTTLENCMQQAGYEAMSWGRPLVTSDTYDLRNYFGDAAQFTAPEAAAIGDAWAEALDSRQQMHENMVELGKRKSAARPGEIADLRALLGVAPVS